MLVAASHSTYLSSDNLEENTALKQGDQMIINPITLIEICTAICFGLCQRDLAAL